MNVYDDEEQHFTLDMILQDNVVPSYRKDKGNSNEEELKKGTKNWIPSHKRLKTKKVRSLIKQTKL